MLSNLEQEEVWLQGWNDLEDLIKRNPNCYILVPGYIEVSLDEAQGWIQDAAYESNRITFSVDFYKGKKSVQIGKVAV